MVFKTKGIRISCLTLLFLAVFIGSNAAVAQSAISLTDISNHWANKQINFLFDKNIIAGDPDSAFRPDEPISRAEFITMINRSFNYTATTNINFSDVNAADWYYWEVARAVNAGYITGYPDGTLRPGQSVTRQEAAAIMARIMVPDTSVSQPLAFTDAVTIPAWSRGAIGAMVQQAYMQGFGDGTFRPLFTLSRAEAAVLVYNAITPKVPVSGVTLDKSSATLYEGNTLALTATVQPANASNQKLTWSSSDESVATVDGSGKVTAVKQGRCTITVATTEGVFHDSCSIYVKECIPVKGVALDKSSVTIGVDYTVTLFGAFEPDNATNQHVAWSSSRTSVAAVSSSGQVTGVRPGTAVITVKTQDGGYFDTCTVTVTDGGFMLINPSSLTMYLHRETTRNIYTKVREDDSDVLGVTWESDDEDIAIISYEPGSLVAQITALNAGACAISVDVVTLEGEYHDSCQVTVLD